MPASGWIGVDFDGTLARYTGWADGAIGDPVPLMNVAAMMPPAWVAGDWPDNLWPGTSIGGPDALYRLPELLRWPAIVRFVSYEPAYGPLPLPDEVLAPRFSEDDPRYWRADGRGLDWLIAGGESGAKAAPSHPDWFREARDRCQAVGVAFHFKQNGEYLPSSAVRTLPRSDKGDVWLFPDGSRAAPGNTLGATAMIRVGRKAAGRLLDGRTHEEFPHPNRDLFRSRQNTQGERAGFEDHSNA